MCLVMEHGGKYFAEFRFETRVSRNMMDCGDIDDTMKKNFNDNTEGIWCKKSDVLRLV